jgi:hypothetical protein
VQYTGGYAKMKYLKKGPRYQINYLIIGITLNLVSVGPPSITEVKQALNWRDIRVAYDAYINCPSHENAMALLATLPIKVVKEAVGNKEFTELYIFGGAYFPILQAEVLAGDQLAIEIMFRLLGITDGAYNETVETVLAGLIRSKPLLFLKTLSVYKDLEHIRKFGPPVDFVPEGYESHPNAMKHEYEQRIEALNSVNDPTYSSIKEECIRKLQEAMKKYINKDTQEELIPDFL